MHEKNITVLSKPACVQCTATFRALDKTDLAYETGEALSAESREIYEPLGIMKAPVVLIRDGNGQVLDAWGGFRPDKIDELRADGTVARRLMEAA